MTEEDYGWEEGPCYLARDRDSAYGEVFNRRLPAMVFGIG